MNRLLSIFRSRRLDRDLDDEIAAHLAMQEEEFRRTGLSEADARAAARREFGGVARTKELFRERRGAPRVESLVRDFLYAVRGLRQHKSFTTAAVLSLALGIGANCAIFTLFRAILTRNLPVFDPETLVSLYRTGGWGRGNTSFPVYLEVKKRTDLFEDVIGRSGIEKGLEYVTGNYFSMLGVAPVIGTLNGDGAVISYELWQSKYGGDPSVLGRGIRAGNRALTVIGVAQRGFRGVEVDRAADVWAPVSMRAGDLMEVGSNWLWIVGRRRPGVSRAQIQAAVDVLFRQYLEGVYGDKTPARFRAVARAQQMEVRDGGVGLSGLRERFGTSLRVLMGAVLLVLLAACANVANLLMARGAARQKEMALRVALGASRARLMQQALVESFVLAGLGAGAGVLLAYWGTGAILAFLPEPVAVAPDGAVLAFALAVTVGAAMVFGLAPRLGMRRVLVSAQVAFSVVLVALAGLFAHSMAELRSVDLGFRHQDVLAFEVEKGMDRALETLERLPGVALVSYAFPGPFLAGTSNANVRVAGTETNANSWTSVHRVGPRYFETIGATLAAGRDIERTDTAKSRPVTVVNEAFLREYLRGERRPLDRLVSQGGSPDMAIVGVVRDIVHEGLRSKPVPTVYVPWAQSPTTWAPTFVVRGNVRPETIRRELQIDGEPRTIRLSIDRSIFQDRLLATLGGFFGLLALALAAVGLYGVVAYGTARRAREIGIRIALGARRGEVVRMVLRDALALVAAGLAIGLPAAYAAARQVGALLFGVKPLDPATIAFTAGVLAAVGVAAALLPACRAARLEPLSVLRQD